MALREGNFSLFKGFCKHQKLTKNILLQGSRVKKGQPLAFIEQLGTFVPVEVCWFSWHDLGLLLFGILRKLHCHLAAYLTTDGSIMPPPASETKLHSFCAQAPQAGEISSFKIEDGKPVEYKDVIVEISPFFGGHIIGDRKYAWFQSLCSLYTELIPQCVKTG